MSWQAYVDQQLVGTGNITKACIIGHNGSTWATSAGFALQGNEGVNLFNMFNDPQTAFTNGVHIGGVKHLALKADNRSIYAKKGAGGLVIVKTNQAILIGLYDESVQPGQATTVVERLADYLIENSY